VIEGIDGLRRERQRVHIYRERGRRKKSIKELGGAVVAIEGVMVEGYLGKLLKGCMEVVDIDYMQQHRRETYEF